MTPPEFINTDVNLIVQQMVADYESRTGRTLQPAQIERLLINSFAYREGLIRERIQFAATQNLVDFAIAPVLDYLGELLGVKRLAASKASTVLQFTIVSGHGGVTVPLGTRVSSVDGVAVFATTQAINVPVGTTVVTVLAECVTEGDIGNGYAIGTITTILDPQAFISAATNTTVTGGGAAQESDEALRVRIKLAPGSFSNAGSFEAYRFFSLSASPALVDAGVFGPPTTPPGEVHIYPLMEDGSITPQTVLSAVALAVNSDKVRPLTDLVQVTAPTQVSFALDVDLTIYNTADAPSVVAQVTTALNALEASKRKVLGQDVTLAQVTAACMVPGVYDVDIFNQGSPQVPFAGLIIAFNEYPFFSSAPQVNVINSVPG